MPIQPTDYENLIEKFKRLGVKARVRDTSQTRNGRAMGLVSFSAVQIDVVDEAKEPYFDVAIDSDKEVRVEAVDVRPKLRHLLLHVEVDGQKEKFLCGHDERHWFVAAVPGTPATVREAFDALKPDEVKEAEKRTRVRKKNLNKRKNKAFLRQGEWFFVPATILVPERLVLKNEPLSRGNGSKPHKAQFCYRYGGNVVYTAPEYREGVLSEAEYRNLLMVNKAARAHSWRVRALNPSVYVRGKISHPDHETITLEGWHRVVMNTENKAPGGWRLVFLD